MNESVRGRLLGLAVWAAYVIVPTDAGGIIRGMPLTAVDTAALLAIGWLAFNGARLRFAAAVAIVLAVSAATASAVPGTAGFRARYFANADASGTEERSIEYPNSAYTRVDRRLSFGGTAAEFPLPFFNDPSRFNFFRPTEPSRQRLAFAVRWSGLWWVEHGLHTVYVHAPRASGTVFVDGSPVIAIGPAEASPTVREIPLTRGWHRLDVEYSSPYASPREFAAGIVIDDAPRPFDATTVMTQPIRDWQRTSATVLAFAKSAADLLALAYLAWTLAMQTTRLARSAWHATTMRERRSAVMSLLLAAAAIEAMAFAWPWLSQNMVLVGGDDTLTYEWYARDILLNGILMNGGRPLGDGDPFYYQAFYPYFLAAMHALFGEGMFGPVLVQRLLAAATAWMLVDIAIALSVEAVWSFALPISILFVGWKFWHIAALPLNESLYVPLMVATMAALIHVCRSPSVAAAAVAGLAGGVAAITRSTMLFAFASAWPACWIAWRARPRRTAMLVTLAVVTLAVFSLITIRNWIVANTFAPTSTELGVTLLGGNEIPPGVTIDLSSRATLYARFGIGDLTAQVIEYALTAPGTFALHQGRKALFALGFYELYAPGWGYSPVYIAVWVSAIVGLVVALRLKTLPPAAIVIPALIAFTQFVAVVLIYPKGERLIVPTHAALLPYAAIAAWRASRWRSSAMIDSSRQREA